MSSPEDKYKAFHRIGVGGNGVVYLGAMRSTGGISRRVAIKRLGSVADGDAVAVQRFTEEAQLLARLDHPNIVSIIDYHIDSHGHSALIMEYVDGCNLAHCVAKGACPPSVAVYVAVEILRALGYLHQMPTEAGMRGLVHRDVSPANILLSWNGMVVLSDFGISKIMDTRGVQTATYRGKAAYSAPEQINNQMTDGRTDLFSVGVVLWEMIAGRALFQAETQAMTFARVLRSPPPSLRGMTSISPELEAIVARLLKRKAEMRYASAEEVIRDLLACAEWPRSGRDELSSLLAERFGREMRVIVPVEDVPPKQALNEEKDQETRTAEPRAGGIYHAGFDWDQLSALARSRSGIKRIAQRLSRRTAYGGVAFLLLLLIGAHLLGESNFFRREGNGGSALAPSTDPLVTPASMPSIGAPTSVAATPVEQTTIKSQTSTDAIAADSKVPARRRPSKSAPSADTKPVLQTKPAVEDISRYRETLRYVIGEDSDGAKQKAASPSL